MFESCNGHIITSKAKYNVIILNFHLYLLWYNKKWNIFVKFCSLYKYRAFYTRVIFIDKYFEWSNFIIKILWLIWIEKYFTNLYNTLSFIWFFLFIETFIFLNYTCLILWWWYWKRMNIWNFRTILTLLRNKLLIKILHALKNYLLILTILLVNCP